MKWRILFFLTALVTGKLDCGDLNLEDLIPDVSLFLAEHFRARCSVVLYANNENIKERNEIFKLTKYLATSKNFASAASFDVYLTFSRHLQENRTCANILGIVLGWQENTGEKFAEFSHQIVMAQYKWLIFLMKDATAERYLKEVDTPFNLELLVGKITEDNVELEEAYRVAKNYPLRVLKYGIWENSGRNFRSLTNNSYLYVRRENLEGIPLRASTRNDFPISRLTRDEKGNLFIEGYFGSVYYALAKELNFTSAYVPAVENATGIQIRKGVWSGLLGMVQRDEIDFVVGPVTFLRDVATIAGALRPLLKSSYQIFFKQHGTVIKWSDILKPFEKYVWLCIVVWILIAAYTLNQLYKLECRYGCESLDYESEYNRTNTFLAFLKALCQQGNPHVPNSNSCRILYITGYFVSVILVTAYSASLISNITTQAPRRPFDSFETFLDDGSYTLIAIQGSTDYSYFSNANDTLRRDIFKKLMSHVPLEDLPTDKEGGIEMVCVNTKFALFITFAVTQLTAAQYAVDYNCPILYFQTPLDTVFLTIARKKHFPYADLIDYKLQTMAERGLLKRLQQRAWPLHRLKTSVNFKQVTIEQVFQIHFILIIGIILSLIFLIVEIRLDERSSKLECEGCAFCPRTITWKIDIFFVNFIRSTDAFQTVIFFSVGIFIILCIVFIF